MPLIEPLFAHLPSLIETDHIVYKELAAQKEEQNDTGDHLGDFLAQVIRGGNGLRTLLQEDDQEREDDHHDAVELGEPCHNDGGEAASAGGGGGNGVGGAGHGNETGQTADGAGENDRADISAVDADAGLACGIF